MPFNLLMTVVVIIFQGLVMSLLPVNPAPSALALLTQNHPVIRGVLFVCILVSYMIIGMYAVLSLWNRVFPHVCGWTQISLAEAYAICLMAGVLGLG